MSDGQSAGRRKRGWVISVLPGTIVGAAIGFLVSPLGQSLWAGFGDRLKSAILIALGAVLGSGAALIYRWQRRPGKRVVIESLPITVPVLGSVSLKFDQRQHTAGWHIFVELASRIATQKLHPRTGLIREALISLYQLFGLIRSELKSMPPTQRGLVQGQADIETYALTILNHAIRPCLARWHPRLKQWELTGIPEGEWPLAALCRRDLETTRQLVLAYTWGLGKALSVSHLNDLLPAEPSAKLSEEWVVEDELAEAEVGLIPMLAAAQTQAGWRIYVEISTRIATQSLAPGSGLVREAMSSLYALFTHVRRELKGAGGPTPPSSRAGPTVEELALRILNQDIRPFLAKWHPALREWEKTNPEKPETEWPEEQTCRAALEAMRDKVSQDCAELGRLIGVKQATS